MSGKSDLYSLYRIDYGADADAKETPGASVSPSDALPSLLMTKLQRPSLPPDNVSRPRLIKSLRRALDWRVTLVSAPTGYGKSTLVAQALTEIGVPCAWLTVDEYDDDLRRFLDYLIAAIQTQFPDACPQTRRLLNAVLAPPVGILAASLLNEIQSITTPFLLVIDDLHYLTDPMIGQLFGIVLRSLPTSLHLVAISQTDPPWPLARLAARGQLLEIRADDLRFRLEEAQTFLEAATEAALPQATIEALVDQTEGWIVGLRLAALAAGGESHRPPELGDLALSNGDRALRLLVHEVLSRQSPMVRDFLLRTCLLDRLNVSLCAALMRRLPGDTTDEPSAQQIGAWLRDTNLFIVPLDRTGEWYRYHHLFRELLRREMAGLWEAERAACLHRWASEWYDEHGFAEEALRHALSAGDTRHAAEIVESQVHAQLNREDWRGVERSLSLLPAELLRQRPSLPLAQAWVLGVQHKLPPMFPLLQSSEAILVDSALPLSEAARKEAWAEINVIRAYVLFWQMAQAPESLALAQQALADLPQSYSYARSVAYLVVGLALYVSGHPTEAEAVLRHVVDAPAEPAVLKMRPLMALAHIHRMAGPLFVLEQTLDLYLSLASESELFLSQMWAHHFRGSLHYERNELEQAVGHLEIVAQQPYLAHHECLRGSLSELGLAYQAQGRLREADAVAQRLTQIGLEFNIDSAIGRRSLDVRLALARQNMDEALRAATGLPGASVASALFLAEVPAIVRAQALVSVGRPSERQQALELLADLEAVAGKSGALRPLVRILALQALALAAAGRDVEALTKLERAVTLAEPMGLVRTFVDIGPALAPLLRRVLERGTAPAYLQQVLAAFAAEVRGVALDRLVREGDLFGPLTEREMDVLRLLERRLTNKEIGDQLFITAQTAKRHIANIYSKLGVHTRREAVLRAQALGLLPQR
ncbi:MAG: LuxR C-terminal-related transcriptional regulator [Anaerolineae bacterium]